MPSKNSVFTTRVDPVSPPPISPHRADQSVEAPGTAPGSAASILQSVYRHSQQADSLYIAWKSLTGRVGVF
jgi:hypothetical protein